MNYYHSTVADIVNERPSTAIIFKKHKIDFCCKGKIPLTEACDLHGLDIQELIDEIDNAVLKPSELNRYLNWSNSMLANYIVENHHHYVREILPQLLQFSARVAEVHGGENSKLVELHFILQTLAAELTDHLSEEENQLFPAILAGQSFDKAMISDLEADHENVGRTLEKIRKLTNDFNPPESACNTYRALFSLLEEFESDMHQHVHLENNVLFRKMIYQ